MRYQLGRIEVPAGDLNLTDEISLIRITIQDIIDVFNQTTQPGQRVAVGSMLRDAIDSLSRVMERAARLPSGQDTLPVRQVADMLVKIEETISDTMPDGIARQQLIMNVKSQLEGISNRELPSVRILRTCEMMDQSVPYVAEDTSLGLHADEST